MMENVSAYFSAYFGEACMWIGLTYLMVIAAVAIDLVTGLRKSRLKGQRISSTGLKRTCRKVSDYLIPMFVLSLIDLMHTTIVEMPWLTIGYGMFCMMCELVSIMESAECKGRLRGLLKSASQLSQHRVTDAIETILDVNEGGTER